MCKNIDYLPCPRYSFDLGECLLYDFFADPFFLRPKLSFCDEDAIAFAMVFNLQINIVYL